MGRKKSAFNFIESLDAPEDIEEENGFSESGEIPGKVLVHFSFMDEEEPLPMENKAEPQPAVNNTDPLQITNKTEPQPIVNSTSPQPVANNTGSMMFFNKTEPLPKVNNRKPRTSSNKTGSMMFFNNAGPAPIANKTEPAVTLSTAEASNKLVDNRLLQKQGNGITPPVDGEFFEIKRTFMFRRSTVRMLNKLKAEHENENVYLSSIVDEAIRFYYGHVLGQAKK